MTITVELSNQEVAALKQFTKLNDDAEAVVQAAREFLRLRRLCELKAVSGKVEFETNWQALEGLELSECSFPQ